MKLKSFGCSFIFGTDLHDDGRDLPMATHSKHTWPALLAQKLGYSYECYARPGSGNLQIWENIANQINDSDPSLFVIGWTWIDRFDYINDSSLQRFRRTPWKTIMPIDCDDLAQTYYKHLHSEHRDKLTSLIYMQSAIDLLLAKGHSFIMTNMDSLILDQTWHMSFGMKPIQDRVSKYLKYFDDKNFVDYSRAQGHEISDTMHPLESAHRDAAQLVYDRFDEYVCG